MKHICIITTSLNENKICTPLMKQIQNDDSLIMSTICTESHHNADMVISIRQLEQEGFLVDEETRVFLKNEVTGTKQIGSTFSIQMEYEQLFDYLNPDIIVLSGSGYETFTAAIAASLNNIPVAHIHGGESEHKTWDDAYGYGITKLSHLHFTSTHKYKNQVTDLGEHPERVFNVGSLLMEYINNDICAEETSFYNQFGIEKDDRYLFVSLLADKNIGSKNRQLFDDVLTTLSEESLDSYKIIFARHPAKGLDKMTGHMINEFCINYPEKAVCIAEPELMDYSKLIEHCSAVISNCDKASVIASSFCKPVINIGTRQLGRLAPGNVINCSDYNTSKIFHALQMGLSAEFKLEIAENNFTPFEQKSTSLKIKEILKTFRKTDINRKEYYNR